jgi:hypothetical protein
VKILQEGKLKKITQNRRINLINTIEDKLEDSSESALNEWSSGFLEDIQKRLRAGKDLTDPQWQKLLEYVRI